MISAHITQPFTDAQQAARASMERQLSPQFVNALPTRSEPQPYWSEEEPTDAEIRDAEKRHKAAFTAQDICELIEVEDPVLVSAFLNKNYTAIGAILSERFEARMDELVEYSVYGRVLNKVVHAAGRVA